LFLVSTRFEYITRITSELIIDIPTRATAELMIHSHKL